MTDLDRRSFFGDWIGECIRVLQPCTLDTRQLWRLQLRPFVKTVLVRRHCYTLPPRPALAGVPRAIGTLSMDFTQRLKTCAEQVDACLLDHLNSMASAGDPHQSPDRLNAAMRQAVLGGGKRIRPFLVIETAALFGVPAAAALDTAAALEFIHCYSLAHDDLPAMDNDELRRGQPTVWKAFDEWTAILAGDALQTLAFEVLARPQTHSNPDVRTALILALAKASGPNGMVGGQAIDLEADKLGHPKHPTVDHIRR